MLRFYVLVAATLAVNAVLIGVLAWAYHSPRFRHRRISLRPGIKVARAERLRTMSVISTLSLAAVVGPTYLFFDDLFHARDTALWLVALQAVGVLLVYDFAYYWLHRAMHDKRLMRLVHGVHHRARNPSTLESFFQHPVELLAGLGLLYASVVVLGPIHVDAFIIAFFVYSNANILIHSGLVLPTPFAAPINALTKKHHVHHQDDFAKNYSSLTPLPDRLFGTWG
ncbi:MAG: sterol desaturase family protein [Myxococcales bacterium]|nr:sterol desaturase family protein [Myxococcales bacterium]